MGSPLRALASSYQPISPKAAEKGRELTRLEREAHDVNGHIRGEIRKLVGDGLMALVVATICAATLMYVSFRSQQGNQRSFNFDAFWAWAGRDLRSSEFLTLTGTLTATLIPSMIALVSPTPKQASPAREAVLTLATRGLFVGLLCTCAVTIAAGLRTAAASSVLAFPFLVAAGMSALFAVLLLERRHEAITRIVMLNLRRQRLREAKERARVKVRVTLLESRWRRHVGLAVLPLIVSLAGGLAMFCSRQDHPAPFNEAVAICTAVTAAESMLIAWLWIGWQAALTMSDRYLSAVTLLALLVTSLAWLLEGIAGLSRGEVRGGTAVIAMATLPWILGRIASHNEYGVAHQARRWERLEEQSDRQLSHARERAKRLTPPRPTPAAPRRRGRSAPAPSTTPPLARARRRQARNTKH